jgi:hypothetical protein
MMAHKGQNMQEEIYVTIIVMDDDDAGGDDDDDNDNNNNNNNNNNMESSNVRVQNIFHRQNNIACSTHFKYGRAATLYTLETWFVTGI